MNTLPNHVRLYEAERWVTFWLSINGLRIQEYDEEGIASKRASALVKAIEGHVRANAENSEQNKRTIGEDDSQIKDQRWKLCEPGEYSRVVGEEVQFEMSFYLHEKLLPEVVESLRQAVCEAISHVLEKDETAQIASIQTHHDLRGSMTFDYTPETSTLSNERRIQLAALKMAGT